MQTGAKKKKKKNQITHTTHKYILNHSPGISLYSSETNPAAKDQSHIHTSLQSHWT